MEIKELIRERVLTEIIAERDAMVLSQHQQIEALQKELEQMRKIIEEKDALLVAYENKAKGE